MAGILANRDMSNSFNNANVNISDNSKIKNDKNAHNNKNEQLQPNMSNGVTGQQYSTGNGSEQRHQKGPLSQEHFDALKQNFDLKLNPAEQEQALQAFIDENPDLINVLPNGPLGKFLPEVDIRNLPRILRNFYSSPLKNSAHVYSTDKEGSDLINSLLEALKIGGDDMAFSAELLDKLRKLQEYFQQTVQAAYIKALQGGPTTNDPNRIKFAAVDVVKALEGFEDMMTDLMKGIKPPGYISPTTDKEQIEKNKKILDRLKPAFTIKDGLLIFDLETFKALQSSLKDDLPVAVDKENKDKDGTVGITAFKAWKEQYDAFSNALQSKLSGYVTQHAQRASNFESLYKILKSFIDTQKEIIQDLHR